MAAIEPPPPPPPTMTTTTTTTPAPAIPTPAPAIAAKAKREEGEGEMRVLYQGWMEKRGAYTGAWRRRYLRLGADGVLRYCGSDGGWLGVWGG